MIRISPQSSPNANFKGWHYFVEKLDYPPDFVAWTDKNIFGYEYDKIARNLILEIDTGGVAATVGIYADGKLQQGGIQVTTNVNDRSRVIALNPSLIGREWYLGIVPGVGGKTQLFRWDLSVVKEPPAVSQYTSYESDFGYVGFKFSKQVWLEYQSANPIIFSIYVDGGNLLCGVNLPAHPISRDMERFYLPVIDASGEFLNKSKTYNVNVVATIGTFKMYSSSCIEWFPLGAGQRLQKFALSENLQLAA
jgi:hypothetical protein